MKSVMKSSANKNASAAVQTANRSTNLNSAFEGVCIRTAVFAKAFLSHE